MELKGFPIPDNVPSYPTWEVYYNYLKEYVKYFQLEKYMKVRIENSSLNITCGLKSTSRYICVESG